MNISQPTQHNQSTKIKDKLLIYTKWLVGSVVLVLSLKALDPSSTWLNSLIKNKPILNEHHQIETVKNFVRRIDNVIEDGLGGFYISMEQGHKEGKIIHLTKNGDSKTILNKLDRPDGLRRSGNKLYIVEEKINGSLLEYDLIKQELREITRFKNPEGLLLLKNGHALISEDRLNGNVFKVNLITGETVSVIRGLSRPEGIAQDSKGNIYVSETALNRVSVYSPEFKQLKLIEGIRGPDQIFVDEFDTLWIAEDHKDAKLYNYKNKLVEVAAGFSFLQGILVNQDGIFLAEQGRNRLLKIHHKTSLQASIQ